MGDDGVWRPGGAWLTQLLLVRQLVGSTPEACGDLETRFGDTEDLEARVEDTRDTKADDTYALHDESSRSKGEVAAKIVVDWT